VAEKPEDQEQLRPLAQRVQSLNLPALAGRLAALDQARDRRGEGQAGFAAPEAEAALERLRAAGGEGVADRAAALEALLRDVRGKLAGQRTPEVLSQRLRHLYATVYEEPRFGGEPRAAAAEFDSAYRDAQRQAQAALKAALGLEAMPDQTGLALDPERHSIIASEAGDDPLRDGTVAAQEAPGWLLDGKVLVAADVVRYTAAGAKPALPTMDEVGGRIEGEWLGKREPK
jgi:hypothetical protein